MSRTAERLTLLSNATATGSAATWRGGKGTFMAEGTFNGATIKLQQKSANGTWIDVGGAVSFNTNDQAEFDIPAGQIRAAVSGGSSPTGLYAYALRH